MDSLNSSRVSFKLIQDQRVDSSWRMFYCRSKRYCNPLIFLLVQ